ncbi:MAG: hypothetical protein KC468_27945, partial [Myxococcales bacterium]|nr:hypothetical protein [Myxococcales bacterium]
MDYDAKFDRPPGRREPPRDALTRAIEALAGPVRAIEPLAGGYSNLHYAVETARGRLVARVTQRPRAELETELAL